MAVEASRCHFRTVHDEELSIEGTHSDGGTQGQAKIMIAASRVSHLSLGVLYLAYVNILGDAFECF